LLAGKLATPLLPPGVVTRGRLLQLLDENGTGRLCVVVAPAGWGKTTLLAEWAHLTADRPSMAWLMLDETDDEPRQFWSYVIKALRSVAPQLGDGALAALRVPGIDPLEVAIPALLNDPAASEARHVLILDDYHVLTDVRIHEAVEYLLAYLPPSLRLVISSRSDPPLPLARMRARGELTEIRAADLRFSAAEAAGLVSTVGQVTAETDVVDPLVSRTEGWAVGLKLAALTIRGAPDPAARAAAVRGDDRHVIDFLTSEVLDRLPADRRDFLVRTAILERLCGSLCDAVLGRTRSATVLEALERADLFVVPLDVHREWYRYHRLFRDVLRRELDATAAHDVPELYQRAAHWYLTAGHVEEAVRLLTAAGDRQAAARLLLSAEDAFLERGTAATYLRLGDQLGDAAVREDPRLAVSMAGAAAQSGQVDRVPGLLDIADSGLRDDEPPYPGWCSLAAAAAMLRAAFDPVVRADPPLMLAHAERAAGLETDPTLQGYVVDRLPGPPSHLAAGRRSGLARHRAVLHAPRRADLASQRGHPTVPQTRPCQRATADPAARPAPRRGQHRPGRRHRHQGHRRAARSLHHHPDPRHLPERRQTTAPHRGRRRRPTASKQAPPERLTSLCGPAPAGRWPRPPCRCRRR
jgi:LuxR family maltose regulon positive regulatory protein